MDVVSENLRQWGLGEGVSEVMMGLFLLEGEA